MTEPKSAVEEQCRLQPEVTAAVLGRWPSGPAGDWESETSELARYCAGIVTDVAAPQTWLHHWNGLLLDSHLSLRGHTQAGDVALLRHGDERSVTQVRDCIAVDSFTVLCWGARFDSAGARESVDYLVADTGAEVVFSVDGSGSFVAVVRALPISAVGRILIEGSGDFQTGIILVPHDANATLPRASGLVSSTQSSLIELAFSLAPEGRPVYALASIFDDEGQILLRLSRPDRSD